MKNIILAFLLLYFVELPSGAEQINFAKKALELNQVNDTKGAITVLNDGITKQPKNAELYTIRGPLLVRLGKDKEALKDYNTVLTLTKDKFFLAGAHFNRALLEYKWKNKKRAEADFKKALELEPKFSVAHTEWGKMLLEQRKKKEALEHFEKAKKLMIGAAPEKSLEDVDKLIESARH